MAKNLLLGGSVSVAAIWFALKDVNTSEIVHALSTADYRYVGLACLVTILSYILRAWRWPFFFANRVLSFADSYRCLIVGFFMNNVLPARLGEFVRAHLGGRALGRSRTSVLATIAGERLADGVSISLLFGVMFAIGAKSTHIEEGRELLYVSGLFGFAAIATIVMMALRHKIFHLLELLGERFPGHLSGFTLLRIRKFIEGLEPMLKPGSLVIITIGSAMVWGIELLAYYFVAQAFGIDLTIAQLSLFLAAVNFSSIFPAAPGGVGVIELFASLALSKVGIVYEQAFAMVVTQHAIQWLMVAIPGTFYFMVTMGGKLPEEVSESSEDESRKESIKSERKLEELLPFDAKNLKPEQPIELSIVIPAYNEEDRLPKTLLSVVEYFQKRESEPNYEIIVVDDGSTDKTAQIVTQFERLSPRVRLLSCPGNKGKGFAVRLGVMNARGERIIFNDADGATPIEEIERVEAALNSGSDIAIGSRALYSEETAVKTLFIRKFMGRVFNGLVNFLILPGIADTQCGFKMFTRESALYVFSRSTADGFSFDVELLFIARKAGCSIEEVPINWTNVAGSKVNLVVDSMKMLRDVLRFRFREAVGGYQLEQAFR